MLRKVTKYLERKGWSYSEAQAKDSIFLSLTGDNGTFHCVIYASEDSSILAFVSHLGSHCPPDKVFSVLDLINSVNNTMLYGNFEINTAGDVKHRTSINLDGIQFSEKILENLILKNIRNIDFARPIFSKMMFGELVHSDAYDTLFPHLKKEKKEIDNAPGSNLIASEDSE